MKTRESSKSWITGCLCALAAESLYGLSYVFTKNVTENASSLSLLGWRFFLAFLVMSLLAATGVIPINLKGKRLTPLLTVAMFNPVIYFIGETMGISRTTASESGVFLACIPVASLAASALLLHKKPVKAQICGILITLSGVLITVLAAGAASSFSPTGYLCLLLGVICYALYSVSVEKASDFSSTEITYIMLACGAAVFVLLALAEGGLNGNLSYVLRLPFGAAVILAGVYTANAKG